MSCGKSLYYNSSVICVLNLVRCGIFYKYLLCKNFVLKCWMITSVQAETYSTHVKEHFDLK